MKPQDTVPECDASDQPAAPTDFERLTHVALSRSALSRRQFLTGTTAFGVSAWLAALAPQAQGMNHAPATQSAERSTQLIFEPVAANTDNAITLPPGFNYHRVVSWGDPLWSDAPPFDHTTRGTAASQALAMGDNNDGMELFEKDGHVLLAVNNEYVNADVIYGHRQNKPKTADDRRKAMAAVGVTVIEIESHQGRWRVVKDSPFNRRVTADTPIEMSGPAAGHRLLQTQADPDGRSVLGTFANCGSGKTPWGTYLTCEENFNYAFRSGSNQKPTNRMRRYGVGMGVGKKDYGAWEKANIRFDIDHHPHEAHRFGYVVEMNPTDPQATPQKRTALGRFKHENAEVVMIKNGARRGHVVVYMGDDERGEFLYKFVSHEAYTGQRDILDRGQLFAAKFYDDGRGEWRALTPEATGMTQAEICVFTREAASQVRATTMDRPEWVAAHPSEAKVYCALTNNKHRGVKANRGGDAMPVGGPNPREKNQYGQIVQWSPDGGDHAAAGFRWKLFVLAGNPQVHRSERAGSANLNPDNMFNSPDGLAFDSNGGLWIQTDGKDSNRGDFAGQGNNQMLLGDPMSGAIHRFLVGPSGAEITGLCWSADKKTMFVGIQHPKKDFPDKNKTPRSSIIAIRRNDGGLIG